MVDAAGAASVPVGISESRSASIVVGVSDPTAVIRPRLISGMMF